MEEWKSFSLTHVEYLTDDVVGKTLAVISLVPLMILCGFTTLVLFRRDLHTIAFLIGQLSNESLNMVLKHVIREPRPMRRVTNYTEYGMPSSHSQFMGFFAAYTILFALLRLPATRAVHKIGLVSLVTVVAALVMYSRVYLRYHSVDQVSSGAVIGAVVGAIWFGVVHVGLTPYFPAIVNWRICEALLIRDTTLIPNILWFEYQRTRTEASIRARKNKTKLMNNN